MSDSADAPYELIDLTAPQYIEEALKRREGFLADNGALCVTTGRRTGRSVSDRFIVREPSIEDTVDWGAVNRPFDPERFEALWDRVEAWLAEREEFISHLHVGDHDDHYLPLEVRTELAWHSLFARSLLIPPEHWNPDRKPPWRLLSAANFECDPERDGTASDAAVIIHFAQRRILLAGMHYAGELKSAVFAVQNFLLPEKDVLPMYCAANIGGDGDTALFFGARGSGKTTLSSDPERPLIGDDEHGWARGALFNLEGGCYTHTRALSPDGSPRFWEAIRFGAIMENVHVDESGRADFSDTRISINGRCCFPLTHLPDRVETSSSAEPKHLFFLCCDASGVLPLVSVLSREAAAFHFLAGYSSEDPVAGAATEGGTACRCSACFSAPYLPRHPRDYAELLSRRIEEAGSTAYLINTGYLGDPENAGDGGSRMSLEATRAVVAAALSGALAEQPRECIEALNLEFPTRVPGVDPELLDPRRHWGDTGRYEEAARQLAQALRKAVEGLDPPSTVLAAGPHPLRED